MFCDDCQRLVQGADHVIPHRLFGPTVEGPIIVRQEVLTQDFQDSLRRKCYFCTRLRVELGDDKWHRILHELPKTCQVVFEKSAKWDQYGTSMLVRLGCELTPLVNTDGKGEAVVFGKAGSFGYLQLSLLAGIP